MACYFLVLLLLRCVYAHGVVDVSRVSGWLLCVNLQCSQPLFAALSLPLLPLSLCRPSYTLGTRRRWTSGFRKNQRGSRGAGPRSQSSEGCSSERDKRRARSARSCPRRTLPPGTVFLFSFSCLPSFSLPFFHRQRRSTCGVFSCLRLSRPS